MLVPEILVVRSAHRAGSLASILQTIANRGHVVEGLKATQRDHRWSVWEITVEIDDQETLDLVVAELNNLPNASVVGRSDRVFDRHRGGKLVTRSRHAIDSDEMLRDVYTPGVARVCMAIAKDPALAYEFTSVGNTVAVVTNGTAVLGLGDIGALAGLPVMEGKAALMAEMVGINGVPILIESHDPEVIIDTVVRIAPSFGAIQLEDIRAPECFAIEKALREKLDKPVMHDDQHGTAVVTLAALLGATQHAGLRLQDCVLGQVGLGAAGLGICRLVLQHGVREMLGADLSAQALQRLRDLGGVPSELATIMQRCDVVVATTGVKGLIKPEMVRPGQVILALSNPDPEIEPHVALERGARYAADGKAVNNVLGFPGIFRGVLDARCPRITDAMLLAAALELPRLAKDDQLVPSPLDRAVHRRVAEVVRAAAA
jgi:malate dehydrogenase (oxaloacetate-decarboxylating)